MASNFCTTKLPTMSPSTLTVVRKVSSRRSIGNKMAMASAGKPTDCKTMTMGGQHGRRFFGVFGVEGMQTVKLRFLFVIG